MPVAPSQGLMNWFEMNYRSTETCGIKLLVRENGRNFEKNLPGPRFVHHETHMRVTEMRTRYPRGKGERLSS